MALVIKSFKNGLKGCNDFSNKGKSIRNHVCLKCGKSGHFLANCPNNDDQEQEKKGNKVEKKKFNKKKDEAHIGKE
jgi:hypothetical protein